MFNLSGVVRLSAGPSIFTLLCCFLYPAQSLNAQSVTAESIANKTMAAHLNAAKGKPELAIEERSGAGTLILPNLFSITFENGSKVQSSELHWEAGFHPVADGAGGQICADMSDEHNGAHFHWCLINHSDREYMRALLTIEAADHDIPIAHVQLIETRDPQAHVIGTAKGSPLADTHFFFGFEHPLSSSRSSNGLAKAGIDRDLPLRAGQSVTYAAVFGSYRPGQMRRAFLAYIEDERPRPYSPFLNYNTWYDIGYTNRYSEADALSRIDAFGKELVTKRHVRLDSFVFDDGWDNPSSLWDFDSGFPSGFTKVAHAAADYHAGIGVWLSPWGGYDEQKVERVAFGKSHGYEIINGGFALSGPRYFRNFLDVCGQMVDKFNVNLFKFDGTGNADRVFPGSAFDSDFAAAIHLIHQIRAQKPGIFINLTTGTFPSPFWLLYADSIWRGGEDHSFAGVGSERQRWMTYRDEQTYRNIVSGGPLFPLNSLMVHGMIYAQQAEGLHSDPKGDFPSEVLSYFGSGTQLQEMYVTPSLLNQSDWDILARAANWSRANADILEDTHWVGGDPGKLQVYGWAAWSPTGWIITLRNPADHPQSYAVNLTAALELPAAAASTYVVAQPFGPSFSAENWSADHTKSVELKPFEVRIFESKMSPN